MKWVNPRIDSNPPLLRPDSAPSELGAIKKGVP